MNECKRVINHVLSILFGLPPEHFFAEADGESSRKTKFFRVRQKGVNGHTLAYYGVVEDHQKGTLHFHFVVYGGIPPAVLQRFGCLGRAMRAIQETLDSMFHSRADNDTHVRHLIHQVLRETGSTVGLSTRDLQTLHYPYILKPNPLAILDENDTLPQEELEKNT